jgi:PAS domain S-box-containing protein
MRSEDSFRAILESAPLGVVLCDLRGTVTHILPGAARLLRARGLDPTELRGSSIHRAPGAAESGLPEAWDVVAAEDPGTKRSLPEPRSPWGHPIELVRLPDAVALYLQTLRPEPGEAEEVERRERQARDFAAFRASYPFGSVAVFDADLRYESVTGLAWAELGVDPSALEGRTFRELWDDETAAHLEELARVALEGREVCQRVPYQGRVYEIWAGPLEGSGGRARGMFLSRDATEEVAQLERIQLLRAALDGARTGVLLVDLRREDEPIVYANQGFLRLTGYRADEVLDRNCRFLQGPGTDPAQIQAMRAAIDRREQFSGTLLNYRKDGTPFWNFVSFTPFSLGGAAPTHYVSIQEDVTEIRRRSQKQEHQARLAELGTLAGTVAHDFNNILMVVHGRAALLSDRVTDPEAREELDAIDEALTRGAELTAQLLTYAKDRSDRAGRRDAPAASARRIVPAVVRLLPERVRVEVRVPEEETLIALPPLELEQILLNLAKNAADAMPSGGTLSVSLEAREENGHVTLRVADTGAGMPPGVQERVFEPFFTTKGDAGTGLGLSTVRKLVERAGGSIRVRSSEGSGTVFELDLPRAPAATPDPLRPLPADDTFGSPPADRA